MFSPGCESKSGLENQQSPMKEKRINVQSRKIADDIGNIMVSFGIPTNCVEESFLSDEDFSRVSDAIESASKDSKTCESSVSQVENT
jgi:hypothetical protein